MRHVVEADVSRHLLSDVDAPGAERWTHRPRALWSSPPRAGRRGEMNQHDKKPRFAAAILAVLAAAVSAADSEPGDE